MLIDLTHNRFQKNDAITRAAWMLCAGAEKRAEKDVFWHSIDRDEAENLTRVPTRSLLCGLSHPTRKRL
jgi:hypothetical protein